MTAPYVFRLLCLSLSSFFLIHLVLALLVRLVAPFAIRWAQRRDARAAVRVTLVVRFLPFGFAVLTVAATCVPSYLRFEPRDITEPVGWACLIGAALSAAICVASIVRGLRAWAHSIGYARSYGQDARPMRFPATGASILVVEDDAAAVLLAGILRPRLLVSSAALGALSGEELAVALRHEHAHRAARDNFKRLLLLLVPDVLPFCHIFRPLERAWARFSEWAADDAAASGDPARSVSLAAALVHLARLRVPSGSSPLVTSLLADGSDLAARVERLLNTPSKSSHPARATSFVTTIATAFALAGTATLLIVHTSLLSVHAALERLIH